MVIKRGNDIEKQIRKAAAGLQAGEIAHVKIEEGDYYFSETVCINSPVTLQAEGRVRFIGGVRLEHSEPVTDEDALSRFSETARARIRQCDLSHLNSQQLGNFSSRGFGREVTPSHSELFVNGVPYDIAQYPKKGEYLRISGFAQEKDEDWQGKTGALEDGFYYDDDRPAKWRKSDDLWVHGYWTWDWANSYERVAEIDTIDKKIKTAPPYGNYGFRAGQRFCFINVPEELTAPGEYYIDRDTKIMYFYPDGSSMAGQEANDEIILSVIDKPILEISGTKDVLIEGVTFEAARGTALNIDRSERVRVDNCLFKNLGNYGIVMTGSRDSVITACTIHDNGDGGISVTAGDRATLTPGNIEVSNNHIHHIAKWSRCYQTAINATGVGISIKNNLIHDCPHTAILFWGNDITIENNEIYNVVMETGDAGAVYTGRDFTFRGNRVCKNYIHHTGGVGMGTMAIYNDDCVSGTKMEGNYFFEVSRAVFLGGGRDFHVEDNVFVNCRPSVEVDGRGASLDRQWRDMVEITMRQRFYEVRGNEPPYAERYPELKEIDAFYRHNKKIPPSAVIEYNLYCSEQKLNFSWCGEKGEITSRGNNTCKPQAFEDYNFQDFVLRPDSEAGEFGFCPADFHAIGLIEEARRENPPKVTGFMKTDAEKGRLELTLRNAGRDVLRFKMDLFCDKQVPGLSGASVFVNLSGGETKTHMIPLPALCGNVTVEARSACAGVRPCRLIIENKVK